MGWKMYGEVLTTTDLSTGVRVFQRRIPDETVILKAIRARFVFYNDPTFDDIYWEIYSYNGTAPSVLLTTSTNVRTKTDLLSQPNAMRESYWEFDGFPMKENETYCFVPRATNYTGSDSSHIALVKAWPDPPYPESPAYSLTSLHLSKYFLTFFTGKYLR